MLIWGEKNLPERLGYPFKAHITTAKIVNFQRHEQLAVAMDFSLTSQKNRSFKFNVLSDVKLVLNQYKVSYCN